MLAAIFLYLAFDEGASVHEQLNLPLQSYSFTQGYFLFGWVLVAAPIVLLIGAAYLRFVFHLPRKYAIGILCAGGLYVTGALGFEMLSAAATEDGYIYNYKYLFMATIEETLEMSGIAVFFVVLWSLLRSLPWRIENNVTA